MYSSSQTKIFSSFLLLFTFLFISHASVQQVIMILGHGFGSGTELLWQQQGEQSSTADFPAQAAIATHNQSGLASDAAAAGTALACGVKTDNGKIGLADQGQPLTSLATMLRAHSWRLGLVCTGAINDALPAAFYGNRESPAQSRSLLGDLVISQFDLVVGSHFIAPQNYTRANFANLLQRGGYEFHNLQDWHQLSPGKKQMLLGDFNDGWPGLKDDTPTLAKVMQKSLEILPNQQGFLLLVIVDAGNDSRLPDSAAHMRARANFDAAIKTALAFQRQNQANTLVVATTSYDADSLKNAPGKVPPPKFWQQQQLPATKLHPELQKRLLEKQSSAEINQWLSRQLGIQEEMNVITKIPRLPAAPTAEDAQDDGEPARTLLANAMRLRDQKLGLTWQSGQATTAPVTTYACGPGQERWPELRQNSDLPRLLAQLLPTAKIDFDRECRQAPLPLPRGRNHQDCLLPVSADDNTITLRYGLLKTPDKPLLARLLEENGTEVASQTGAGKFGFITFNNLRPATKYQAVFELNDEKTVFADLETLPMPPGEKLFTFALIADTHLSLSPDLPSGRLHGSSVTILERIVAELNQWKIPLMLHAGDVTDASTLEELAEVERILPMFQGKSICVPGNHDRLKGEFARRWIKHLGPTAGLTNFQGVQILTLDTADSRLGKQANLDAINALDLDKPAIIVSHFQLLPDPEQIKDKNAAISDRDKQQEALARLGRARAVIYVGHKNVPCQVKLGQVTQINAPQTTQFLDGYLLVDVYTSGVRHRFVPASTAYISERSRLCGGARMTRAQNNFKVWNSFLPWP